MWACPAQLAVDAAVMRSDDFVHHREPDAGAFDASDRVMLEELQRRNYAKFTRVIVASYARF